MNLNAVLFRRALPILLLALATASCSRRIDNALVIGMEMSYPPFEMRGTDNQPDGISVRMGEDLAWCLGRPVRFEDVAWDGVIPALQAKKIDLIISSMTRTEEREKTIDCSDGYVTNGLCMLVGKDSAIRNADDLPESNAMIAVKLGTTGHVWAQLREGVNTWMRQFREAGKFDVLADRYMAEEKKTFQEMGVPFIFH